MRLLVNQFNKEEGTLEILVNKDEAKKISLVLLNGAEFIKIGDQTINAKYIIGVVGGGEPPLGSDRQITAPKPQKQDFEKIGQMLKEMRKDLTDKGVLKINHLTKKNKK